MRAKVTLSAILVMTILATLAWQTDTARGQVVTDGLISYWSFDRAAIAGETAKDVWGNNHGTIVGDPKKVEGKIGEALEFDGSDDYVNCGNNESWDITGEITLEAWVKLNSLPDSNGRIINKGSGDTEIYNLLIVDGSKIRFTVEDIGTRHGVEGSLLSLNVWYHLVGTYDGRKLSIYVDGVLSGSVEHSGGIDTSTGPLAIGARPVGDRVFPGIIDEVRVYNRALSEDEVKRNFVSLSGVAVNPADKLSLSWGEIKVSR